MIYDYIFVLLFPGVGIEVRTPNLAVAVVGGVHRKIKETNCKKS